MAASAGCLVCRGDDPFDGRLCVEGMQSHQGNGGGAVRRCDELSPIDKMAVDLWNDEGDILAISTAAIDDAAPCF